MSRRESRESRQQESRESRRRLQFSKEVCGLCHSHHSHLSSPKEWRNQEAIAYATSQNISLVCRPCRDEITRVLANPSHVPRWRKGVVEKCVKDCCIKHCSNQAFHETSAWGRSELECITEIEVSNDTPVPIPICKQHYHLVYNILQQRKRHCITCGRRLQQGNDRPCPKPKIIQRHLQQ